MADQKELIRQTKYIYNVQNVSWRVRVRVNKRTIEMRFCFEKYGSKKRALESAILWRDALLDLHGLSDRLNVFRSPNYYSNKPKAIIGVYRAKEKYSDRWVARYSLGNDEIKRHFAVNKYGEKPAFQYACQVRYEQCGKLRIVNRSLIPCLPKVPYTILRK